MIEGLNSQIIILEDLNFDNNKNSNYGNLKNYKMFNIQEEEEEDDYYEDDEDNNTIQRIGEENYYQDNEEDSESFNSKNNDNKKTDKIDVNFNLN